MTTAVATSLIVIVLNSAAGFTAHLSDAALDIATTAAFTGTAILGSLTAGRLAPHLPSQKLRRWFAYLVLAVAIYVTIQATQSLIS